MPWWFRVYVEVFGDTVVLAHSNILTKKRKGKKKNNPLIVLAMRTGVIRVS